MRLCCWERFELVPESLFGALESLVNCIGGAVESGSDLGVRQALPSGEEQDFLIARTQLDQSPPHSHILLCLHNNLFRTGWRGLSYANDSTGESPESGC